MLVQYRSLSQGKDHPVEVIERRGPGSFSMALRPQLEIFMEGDVSPGIGLELSTEPDLNHSLLVAETCWPRTPQSSRSPESLLWALSLCGICYSSFIKSCARGHDELMPHGF